jgi:hypothetical protein
MTENQKKVLELLAQNKITSDEAYRLLNAMDPAEGETRPPRSEPQPAARPKYLRVTVQPDPDNPNPGKPDRVNIRIPLSLVRAGMKLTSLIPPHAYEKVNGALRDKGIAFDLRTIKPEDLEDVLEALKEMQIDIEGNHGERVRVYAE